MRNQCRRHYAMYLTWRIRMILESWQTMNQVGLLAPLTALLCWTRKSLRSQLNGLLTSQYMMVMRTYDVFTLKIKTSLSDASVNEVIPFIRSTMYMHNCNGKKLDTVFPNDDLCQLLHPCVVLRVVLTLYNWKSEVCILYCAAILVTDHLKTMARLEIGISISTSVDWDHESTTTVLQSHSTPF